MGLINNSFKQYPLKFLLQSLLVSTLVFIGVALLAYSSHTVILSSIGASSIAASAFICFMLADINSAKVRNILGSYIIAIIAGILCSFIAEQLFAVNFSQYSLIIHIIFSTLAITIAVVLMLVINIEHPPALGLALGLVLDIWDLRTIICIITTIILMVAIKVLLRKKLVCFKGE
jgi:succinate-acetate transporter protein